MPSRNGLIHRGAQEANSRLRVPEKKAPTPRELEVALWIREGKSEQIGKLLAAARAR